MVGRSLEVRKPVSFVLLVSLLVVLSGCIGVDDHTDTQPTQESNHNPEARSLETELTIDTRSVSLLPIERPTGSAGLLVLDLNFDEKASEPAHREAAWVPEPATRRVMAQTPMVHDVVDGAVNAETGLPILLAIGEDRTYVELIQLAKNHSFAPERVPVQVDGEGSLIGWPQYGITANGTGVLGFSLTGDVLPYQGAFLKFRPEGAETWTTHKIADGKLLRDLDVEHDTIHTLLAGADGTHYYHAQIGERVDQEDRSLVFLPRIASGLLVDAAPNGTVAVLGSKTLSGEPTIDAGVQRTGAIVALGDGMDWEHHSTFRPYGGGYADLRISPTLRIALSDPDSDQARKVIYAPAADGGTWHEVSAYPSGSPIPFLEDSPYVAVPRGPSDPATWWYDLHALS